MKNKLIPNPTRIGEKLKNRRLELGWLQKDVANAIGVCEDSITGWENDRSEPAVCFYPKIIHFLGYMPFTTDDTTLGGRIKMYRYIHGLTQENLAVKLQINESTVFHYENNKHIPLSKIYERMSALGI